MARKATKNLFQACKNFLHAQGKKRYQEIGKRELINHQTLTIKNYYILTAT